MYIYIYTHKNTTHTGTNKRQSSFPSNKASFDQAVPPYQKALNECGYRYTPLYEPTTTNKRKNRQLPFPLNVVHFPSRAFRR